MENAEAICKLHIQRFFRFLKQYGLFERFTKCVKKYPSNIHTFYKWIIMSEDLGNLVCEVPFKWNDYDLTALNDSNFWNEVDKLWSIEIDKYDEISDMKEALIFLGADYAEICGITSKLELYAKLRKHEDKLLEKGVNYKIVKELYNEKIPMEARIRRLNIYINALRNKYGKV